MEARKITIVSTKTQKKSVIMSGAETLSELKRDLDAANIDYENMTFYEGTSKTELKLDESVLPKDVPYTNRTTGETINTNELVFMLTNTNKKIRSGSVTLDRKDLFNEVKHAGLQEACKDKYGKNYTHCTNDELVALIQENVPTPCEGACVDVNARAALALLVDALWMDGNLDKDAKEEVLDTLNNGPVISLVGEDYRPDSASPYSDNEIDTMFDGLC